MTEQQGRPVRRWSARATTLAAAAAIAVGILAVAVVTRDGRDQASPGPPAGAGNTDDWQWISYHDVEVRAPAKWAYAYEAGRPDCIDDPQDPKDPWARDVPRAPYVTVGTPNRPVPAIGCFRKPKAGDPPPAFGDVPFVLWQPYVKLAGPRNELQDGRWEYHGWHLTRATDSQVQVTVLAPPDRPNLGADVTSSVRHVKTTSLGCQTGSPVQAEKFTEPTGAAIPDPRDVAAIAVCQYSRAPGRAGLEGSRRISGAAARSLVSAIVRAPRDGGPDQPSNCLSTMYGDEAIVLRFFGSDRATPLAEAYVYYNWCFGNGIVDSSHRYRLTRGDCAPLFDTPPIGFWGGTARLFAACATTARAD